MALHLLAHPGVLAAGAGALALLGFGGYKLMQKRKGGVKSKATTQPKATEKTVADACLAGTNDGNIDGATDTGTGEMVKGGRLLSYSTTDASVQSSYESCYDAAYGTKFIAKTSTGEPAKKADIVKDDVELAKKTAAKAAWLAGCSRGVGFGWKDAANGYENRPTPSTSKFSTKVANAAYVYSYSNSYNVGYYTRDKMSGLPGYDEGENTAPSADIESSAISTCASRFESWYASSASVSGFGVSGFKETAVSGFKGAVAGFMVAGFPGAVVGAMALPVVVEAKRHGLIPERYHAMVRGLPHAVTGAAGGFAVAGLPGAFVGAVALPVVALIRNQFRTAPKDRPAAAPNPPAPSRVGAPASRRDMMRRRTVPA